MCFPIIMPVNNGRKSDAKQENKDLVIKGYILFTRLE